MDIKTFTKVFTYLSWEWLGPIDNGDEVSTVATGVSSDASKIASLDAVGVVSCEISKVPSASLAPGGPQVPPILTVPSLS